MKEYLNSVVDEASQILSGRAASPDAVLALVTRLHAERQFGPARKLLERISEERAVVEDPKLRLRVAHKRALSTYKDPDLPTETRLELALTILQAADDLKSTTNQETLGQAGAIHKRLWGHTGRERHLETSLGYYLRGLYQGVRNDYGYTAINAAFILDVLADLESPESVPQNRQDDIASERRLKAKQIRASIVEALVPLTQEPQASWLNETWWFLVTIGEAYWGLEEYARAEQWLLRARQLPSVPDWELESAARQLANLFQIQERSDTRAGQGAAAPATAGGHVQQPTSSREYARTVLKSFLGDADAALSSALRGKVGLALSGGGFRASLYHIGVLAKLAELDLLRHVEYLSCVSGGSILGAHYYLEVRRLLRSKADAEITRDDYIKIVQRMSRDFLKGVERNVRTRIAAEWWTNIRMMFCSDYSRTQRAGELYESEIYSRVDDGEGRRPRWLNQLKITPKGELNDFNPKDHNWRRANKVPILVLNATTLNTGHNWQFTASWMGEPPAGTDSEVDANSRLRRMYYWQAPRRYENVRLGYAVAASACVPGLFEPLALPNLYPGRVVRLVDGGVQDNQGTSALLEQGCNVLLVSDASGQMDDQDAPSGGILSVPLRSNSILQSRVRVSQFEELESRRRGGTLTGLMFIHLKKGLEPQPVDWTDCPDPTRSPLTTPLTSYGVRRAVQRKLAAVRTDLDSFSEAEAYALMTDGYLMTEEALEKTCLGFEVNGGPRAAWSFLQLEPLMRERGENTPLLRQLNVANHLAFRVWLLMRKLQLIVGGLMLVLLIWLGYSLKVRWQQPLFKLSLSWTARDLVFSIGSAVVVLAVLSGLSRFTKYRKTVQEILIGLGMSTLGFVVARIHLYIFDRLFLWQGRCRYLLDAAEAAPQDDKPSRTSDVTAMS